MENSNDFLRQLSRFNGEVSHSIGGATNAPQITERLAACRDAERDLREAIERCNAAGFQGQPGESDFAQAYRRREAELDVRVACADAEAQVWTLIASSDAGTRLQWLWERSGGETPPATWQASANRPALVRRFFSVARVRDDSYRFFAIRTAA